MEPFVKLTAIGAPLDVRNLDTNQLCPTHFNKKPRSDPDYHRILLNAQRFRADGSEIEDYILNREPYRRAGILVGDDNFGCGSSRESAVYALLACGIRAVLAPSFGDIFFNNSLRNGMLPVRLPAAVCDTLRAALLAAPGAELSIDLQAQTVSGPGGLEHTFSVPRRARRALLAGLDEIGQTLELSAQIEAFETAHKAALPWVFAPPAGS